MSPSLPDPELVRTFGRVVRARLEAQIAKEREQSAARRSTILPLVRAAIAHARATGLCGDAWLFGSYAWGEPGERSDVDLLVDACADPLDIASVVGRACGLDVHVIERSTAPASLWDRVRENGIPI